MRRPIENTGLLVTGLNLVSPRDAGANWTTTPVDQLVLDMQGLRGRDMFSPYLDRHYGATRIVRNSESNLAGRTVRNDRQVSIVETGDMITTAYLLDLPIQRIEDRSQMPIGRFMAGIFAANILLDSASGGMADINSTFQPGSILTFSHEQDGVTGLVRVTEYNRPCRQPAGPLMAELGNLGIDLGKDLKTLGEEVKSASEDTRGWVGSVYAEGRITTGNSVAIQQPFHPYQ